MVSRIENADLDTPAKLKEKLASASFVGKNRVDCNIKGNKYRLVVSIDFQGRVVYVRFVGTHEAYNAINVSEV